MKKLFIVLSFISLIVLSGFMVGCGKKTKGQNNVLKSDSDMVAFAAASTANIFNSTSAMPTAKKLASAPAEEIDMDKVNEYVQMMENLLADDGPMVVNHGKSDREGFEFMTVYEIKDLAGDKSSLVIYYNQVLDSEEEQEKQEAQPVKKAEEEKEDESEEEEIEQEYTLEGIAIVDGVEYTLSGKKELENDEYELSITINFDEQNKVVLEEEIEKGETEYKYLVIKDGKKFLELEFEAEEVDKEIEIEIVSNEKGYKESYVFEKEIENGKTVISIKYKANGKTLTIKATGVLNEETGVVEYTYKVKETQKEYHYEKGKHNDEQVASLQ